MEPIKFEEVLRWTGGTSRENEKEIVFSGISTDSRCLCKDCLFVALRGKNFDGHNFVLDAVKSGALGILTERQLPYNVPQIIVDDSIRALGDIARNYKRKFNCTVIGITGSDGKTTTKEMSAFLLGSVFNVCCNQGNFNNEIGLPLSMFNISKKTEIGIFELGMNGKNQLRYLGDILRPDIVVITSIGYAHLGFFKNRRDLAEAKAEILENISIDGITLFNEDTDFYDVLREKGAHTLKGIGLGPSSDFRGFVKNYNEDYFDLEISLWKNIIFRINSWNGAIAYPALFSIFLADYFGIPKNRLPAMLHNFVLIGGRGKIRISNDIKIFDESYNANPGSMKTAIEYFALQKAKRKIVIIGAMAELGKWSKFYHKKIADIVRKSCFDFVFTIGDDARIISDSVENKGMHFDNLEDMIKHVCSFVKPGDSILVKGSRINQLDVLVQKLTMKTEKK
ncbi:MAG TPA: UDP-N-acetylmuramoyl-tripeptide--D-alanyl-D-alanine ligase [bacterium]|nr:UDP-N-acetylmuramoyl-tripeptide--D-alanyl-D-alanine ligase [bacterium]